MTAANACRIAVIAAVAATSFPLTPPRPPDPTDRAWMRALDIAREQKLVHGRDFFWTWGPLGWAAQPAAGPAFRISAWIAITGVWAAAAYPAAPVVLTASAVCFIGFFLPRPIAQNPELQLAAAAVLAAMLAVATRRRAWLLVGITIASILFPVKFTAAAMAAMATLAATAVTRQWLFAALLPAGAIVAFACFAPIDALAGYLTGAAQLSSAYIDVMMRDGRALEPLAALASFAIFAAALRGSPALLAVAAGPWWISMKHSLIRPDQQHLPNVFAFTAVLTAFAIARDRSRARAVGAAVAQAAIFLWAIWPHAAAVAPVEGPPLASAAPFVPLGPRFDAASTPMRLLPIPQLYQAGTPWLDVANANWLDREGPPEAAIEWAALEARHPWLDAPNTWWSVLRNYETARAEGTRVWLRRLGHPRAISLRSLARATATGQIEVPAGTAAIRIHISRTAGGHVRRVLYRVPELRLAFESAGVVERYRVPPQVLSGPLPLAILPAGSREIAALFAGKPAARPVRWLRLDGPGRAYFQDSFEIEFFSIDGLTPATAPLWPAPSTKPEPQPGAVGINLVERAALDNFLTITGWAIDPEARAPALVAAVIDGVLYPARTGFDRPDVATHFKEPGYSAAGFVAIVPVMPGREIRFRAIFASGRYVETDARIFVPSN